MNFPLFLSIEPSTYEETAYPIEIAWSLNDGQIKSTLIIPEAHWTQWSPLNEDTYGISRAQLYAQGVSTTEVIRELEYDLENRHTAYLYDHDYEFIWLDRLFNGLDLEPPFEIISAAEFMQLDPEQLRIELHMTAQDLGLDTQNPSGRVTTLLHSYRRWQQLIETNPTASLHE